MKIQILLKMSGLVMKVTTKLKDTQREIEKFMLQNSSPPEKIVSAHPNHVTVWAAISA